MSDQMKYFPGEQAPMNIPPPRAKVPRAVRHFIACRDSNDDPGGFGFMDDGSIWHLFLNGDNEFEWSEVPQPPAVGD